MDLVLISILVTNEHLLPNHIILFRKFKSLIFLIIDHDRNGFGKPCIKFEQFKELNRIVDTLFHKMKVDRLI